MKKIFKFLSGIAAGFMACSIMSVFPAANADTTLPDRYTVLVLDTSGSMTGEPITQEREAAKKFCNDILSAEGNNYVAIVSLNSSAKVISSFTSDISELSKEISSINSRGNTNYYSSLQTTESLLKDVDTSCIRNIVFCSDGLPVQGKSNNSGIYTSSDHSENYTYANAAYEYATSLKKDYNIYTLGFFHSLLGSNLEFGRKVMKDLASSAENYYDVTDPSLLTFTFGTVAKDVLTYDKDPIIIIPGILGSRLFLDSNCSETDCVWPPSDQKILQMIAGKNISDTLYIKSPENQNTLQSSEREYGAQNCMKEIVESLCTKYPNRDIYVYNYDWRKSSETSAENLNSFIKSLNVNKVDIVAHSMGGIVTSKYFVRYGKNDVDKIITCGTPYEGAPKLIDLIQGSTDSNSVSNIALSLLNLQKSGTPSYDSIAQLAPTKNYVSVTPMWRNSDKPFSAADSQLTYDQYSDILDSIFTSTCYRNAVEFQQSLNDSTEYNALLGYDKAYFLVGTGQKTISAVKFQYSNNKVNESDLLYTTKGDGTVPYLSASIMNKISGLSKDRYITLNCSHNNIIKDENAILWVEDILDQKVPSVQCDPNTGHAYMVIRIACPVDVKITDGSQVLSSVKGSESFNASFGRLDIAGKDNDIKLICMDNDTGLGVKLTGTDTGVMNYTVRYYSADDELIGERIFENVPITDKTVIDTKADAAESTVLNVDNDGDGTVDKVWTAKNLEALTVPDDQRISLTGVNISADKSNLTVGNTAKITVKKVPENSTDDMIFTFTSSNESVATVNNEGIITAVSSGKSVIKVITANGFSKELEITVKNASVTTSAKATSKAASQNSSPKTGDETPISIYIVVMLAVSGITMITRRSKKSR